MYLSISFYMLSAVSAGLSRMPVHKLGVNAYHNNLGMNTFNPSVTLTNLVTLLHLQYQDPEQKTTN